MSEVDAEGGAEVRGVAENPPTIIAAAGQAADDGSDKLAALQAQLKKKYTNVTFKWRAWREETTPWRTYFVAIEYKDQPTRNAARPSICLLCKDVYKLKHSGNGPKHLETKHGDPKEPFAEHASAPKGTIRDMFAAVEAADRRSEAERNLAQSRSKYMSQLRETPPAHRALVLDLLTKLCSDHLLPYSFIEWPALVRLVETCMALPASRVSKKRYNRLKSSLISLFSLAQGSHPQHAGCSPDGAR